MNAQQSFFQTEKRGTTQRSNVSLLLMTDKPWGKDSVEREKQ